MGILANLGVTMSMDSTKFKQGLDDATKNLQKFEANVKKSMKNAQQAQSEMGATMGKVTAGVAAFLAVMYKVAEKADSISDMADAFDVNISSILNMGKAMKMAGGDAENLDKVLSKLASNAQDARDGSDKLRDSFKSIGITAQEVEKLNPDDLFNRVAYQLAQIEDPITRNAKAMDLLGKAAKGIDWSKYVDEYKQVADPQLAAAIKEAADAWDNMQKGASSFYNTIVKLMQPLFAFYNHMMTLADRYEEFKKEGGVINFDPNNPMAEGIEYKGEGKPKSSPIGTPNPKYSGQKWSKPSEKEQSQAEQLAKEIAALKEAFKIKVAQLETTARQIERETELMGLTEMEAERKKIQWSFEDENLRMQLDLEKQINEEKAKGAKASAEKIQLLKNEQEAYKALTLLATDNAQKELAIKEQKIRTQQILTNTEKDGLNQLVDNFAVLGQQSRAAFNAWKAFSIVNTLIDTYSGAQKAFTSLAGIPFVGPALGAAAAGVAIAAGIARVNMIRQQQYQGRQFGGSMVANTPYIVGERGPELVVPHRGGTVIPNNQLSNHLGGQPSVVYNGPYIANMQAIDTQSAQQFLAKNKNSVYAANLSAQRGLPASRT